MLDLNTILLRCTLFYSLALLKAHQFDASRRGKKTLRSSRDNKESTYRSGAGGEGPLCDPGSELLLGGSAREVRG